MKKPRISAVVAIGVGGVHNRAIGKGNELLWHIPEDLKRFKAITLGHPVLMGRKTFESIVAVLGKALPGRTNIVITRDRNWSYPDVVVAHSLAEAIETASAIDTEEIFIGGGSQIYAEALPLIDRLYLTLIEDEKEADTYFPPYEDQFIESSPVETHEWNGIGYKWVTLDRPSSTEGPS